MKSKVQKLVSECGICQKIKYNQREPMDLLQPLPILERIWKDLAMDFVECLPTSRGFETILIVIDCLSKGAHFISLKYPFTANSVTKVFVKHVIKLLSLPKIIMTDRSSIS